MSFTDHIDNKKRHSSIRNRSNTGIRTYFNCRKNLFYLFYSNKKEILLKLHYNRANSYLFVNGTEIYKFKAKDSEIVASLLCLGNISKDWSTDNMKKTRFNGYIYDFRVDYDVTNIDNIKDNHKYLMKKNNIV